MNTEDQSQSRGRGSRRSVFSRSRKSGEGLLSAILKIILDPVGWVEDVRASIEKEVHYRLEHLVSGVIFLFAGLGFLFVFLSLITVMSVLVLNQFLNNLILSLGATAGFHLILGIVSFLIMRRAFQRFIHHPRDASRGAS